MKDMQDLDILIFHPGVDEPEIARISIPKDPNYGELNKAIGAFIGPNNIEHVAVPYEGERADMFVDEFSAINPRKAFDDEILPDAGPQPVNKAATQIYHAASFARGDDLSQAPLIYGNAVITTRRVWR